jgi:ubiquinone/menaquinone biosynthesis C-methylase UbiE
MLGGCGAGDLPMQLDETIGWAGAPPHVPESRFGLWFLGTETWAVHVVARAIADLERLIKDPRVSHSVVVDVGCGFGHALELLHRRFRPQRLIGIDVDRRMLDTSAALAARNGFPVELKQASSAALPLADASCDMVFCHQTFHHFIDQEAAIAEFRRVLRPGGLLLFAESTRAYIHSWIIRLLFRHPMEVQKSADEYIALIRGAGFDVAPDAISYPYLWWSRPDLGIAERWFGVPPSPNREETLVNLVAVRR